MNVRVIGLGNVLMSDDGFGPYVVRVLEAFYEVSSGIQLIDAGTPGLDLSPSLRDADVVILVDTVKAAGPPGDLRRLERVEILQALESRLTPHDGVIIEALRTVAATGKGPWGMVLFGVVPEWVATGVRLSRPVRSAIMPVIGQILAELQQLGYHLQMRTLPRHPDTWWEREADLVESVYAGV